MRTVQVAALASAAVLLSMIVNLNSRDVATLPDRDIASPQNSGEWDAYGGNTAGTRYAPLDQINRDNVHKLTRVWEAETGMVGRLSATPLQIDDGIYLCTAQNIMLALDADTGAERWRFDPENDTPPYGIIGNCRGVTYVKLPDAQSDEILCRAHRYCHHRCPHDRCGQNHRTTLSRFRR